jgi:hypothetical protein
LSDETMSVRLFRTRSAASRGGRERGRRARGRDCPTPTTTGRTWRAGTALAPRPRPRSAWRSGYRARGRTRPCRPPRAWPMRSRTARPPARRGRAFSGGCRRRGIWPPPPSMPPANHTAHPAGMKSTGTAQQAIIRAARPVETVLFIRGSPLLRAGRGRWCRGGPLRNWRTI